MARGKRVDLFMGTDMDEGWQEIEEVSEQKHKTYFVPEEHRLMFKREKRRGKVVTLVGPFHLDKQESIQLLKALKKSLGCGGTIRDEWMEFQGELQVKLRPLLSDHRFCLR